MPQYMWGPHGEYGPFNVGKDGYPASGEVVRHYRIAKGLSAAKFGELYGQALATKFGERSDKPVKEQPKSRIWVLTMEKRNNVPTDITRRRVIVDLLGIPPVLLGLADNATKQVVFSLFEEPRIPIHQTIAQQALNDHQQTLTLYFNGYYHRHGQAALNHVDLTTQELKSLLPLVPERSKSIGIALISRYHQFGVMIAREQQNYELALTHADQAVHYAQETQKIKPNSDLLAITLYRRGITSFEQETTRLDAEGNIQSALPFLESALSHAQHATPSTRGFVEAEWALVHAYTARTEKEKSWVRRLLESSYRAVSTRPSGSDEEFINFTPDWFHIVQAEALIALGDYSDALGALELAEELTPLMLPRRFAYIDALRAKAHLELDEIGEATRFAKDALVASRAVKSEFNIARIAQLYKRLPNRKRSGEIVELARELVKVRPHVVHE